MPGTWAPTHVDSVGAWFARQAERERRAVLLEDALLGGQFLPYIAWRLRYWLARYGLATLVQVVQVVMLHRLFPTEGFLVLVGLLAAASLVTAGWWGVLEHLRARVRDLYASGAPHAIGPEIGRWLGASIGIGAVCAAVALAYVAWRAASPGGAGPVDVAAAAIGIRVAVDLPRRCYHSGIYAIRRVHRPLPSMLALEIVSVGSLLALVPFLGTWAAPVAELVAISLVTVMSVVYTARAYRLAGLAPHRHLRSSGRRRHRRRIQVPGQTVRSALAPGLAAASMSLDSLVVLGVFAAVQQGGASWPFALAIAAGAPSVRAGFDWAQLLYFDLKRLDDRPFADLRRRFVRRATLLAPMLGLGFWAIAGLAGTAIVGLDAWRLELGLLPFFLGSSVLAVGQMDAFSSRSYRPIAMSGAVFAGGMLALGPLGSLGVGSATGLVAVVWLALGVFVVARRLDPSSAPERESLPTAWLERLVRDPGPVSVGSVRLGVLSASRTAEERRAEAWRTRQLARRLAHRLGAAGTVATFGEDQIAWFERDGRGARRVDREWLLRASGGRVRDVHGVDAANGAAAVASVVGWRLPGPVGHASSEASGIGQVDLPSSADALARAFERAFPDGVVVAPGRPLPRSFPALAARDRRLLLSGAIRHARGLSPASRQRFDVTAYSPRGVLELIFLVERAASPRAARNCWRAVLRAAHLAAALAPAMERAAPAGRA